MPELKPVRNFHIEQHQKELLEQALLRELNEIEKEIGKFRKEQDEHLDRPFLKYHAATSEEEEELDALILKHGEVIKKLRIIWTHDIVEQSMFYLLYGNGTHGVNHTMVAA